MTEFDLHWAEVRRKHIERRRVIVFSMGFIFSLELLMFIAIQVANGISNLMIILLSV